MILFKISKHKNVIMEKDKIQICDECESEFNKDSSEMKKLCPEYSWV